MMDETPASLETERAVELFSQVKRAVFKLATKRFRANTIPTTPEAHFFHSLEEKCASGTISAPEAHFLPDDCAARRGEPLRNARGARERVLNESGQRFPSRANGMMGRQATLSGERGGMRKRRGRRAPFPVVRRRLRAAGFRLFPRTMFGPAVVCTVRHDGEPIRVLSVGGAYQTATYLGDRRFDLVFPYYRAFDAVFSCGAPVRRVLAIGGGGCAWPKHAAATRPDLSIDVVEIDPAIARIARELFFVGELEKAGTLRLIAADGRAYLETTDERYDAIVVDVFAGTHVVSSLATLEAAHAAKRVLREGGVYLANIVSRESGADIGFLLDEIATFSQVFAHVFAIPCTDAGFAEEDNYLLVATDGPWVFDDTLPLPEGIAGTVLRDE